jgi:hypothetical protein
MTSLSLWCLVTPWSVHSKTLLQDTVKPFPLKKCIILSRLTGCCETILSKHYMFRPNGVQIFSCISLSRILKQVIYNRQCLRTILISLNKWLMPHTYCFRKTSSPFVFVCKKDTPPLCNLMYKFVYRVFQRKLYNFESLYDFIQRTCTTFWTVIM